MVGVPFIILLIAATLLTALVTGLLFGFALVTMPGIRKLGDREFLRAFQVMDRIIQNNHPLFIVVWAGSALLLLVSGALGIGALPPVLRITLIVAVAGYFAGVQIPTVTINVPMNNALQKVDLETAPEEVVRSARRKFEARWNRWNRRRTIAGTGVTVALLVVLGLL